MSVNTQSLSVKCPTCQRLVPWTEDQIFKPFCCERCKLIDLGEWASEDRRIPGDSINQTENLEEDSFYQ